MQRSSNAKRHSRAGGDLALRMIALSFAGVLLTACGLVRQDEQKAVPVTGTQTASPGKTDTAPPEKPALQKPADKGDPQQRFSEALALFKGNQIAEAEQSFSWITQDFPGFAGPWTNLGIIYAKSNRNPQAIAAFIKAVELNRDDATAYNWLGILYRQMKDYARAESAYIAALKADPDLGLAHLNLGILYDEYLKRPSAALPHYKDYLRLGGKDDLRVQAWVAQIENPNPGSSPTKGAQEKP